MQSLASFLAEQDLDEGSDPDKLEEAKRTYWADYRRRYWRSNYRPRKRRVTISFDPADYERVDRATRKAGKKMASYGRDCILATLDRVTVSPDRDRARRFELALIRIGTNVNQVARLANRKGRLEASDVDELNHWLARLEDEVRAFCAPVDLLEAIESGLDGSPELGGQIHALLDRHKAKTNGS